MNWKNRKIFKLVALLHRSFWNYRWHIGLMGLLTVVSGILEGIGINAIIPLFSFIDGGKNDPADIISKLIKQLFFFLHIQYSLHFLLIFIIVLFLSKSIFLFFGQYVITRIVSDYQQKTRNELLRLFLLTDWPYLSKQKMGHLDQIFITQIRDSSTILVLISNSFLLFVNIFVYSFLVVNTSWGIAVLALLFGMIGLFLLKPQFYKTQIVFDEILKKSKDLGHFLSESIVGMKSIKSMSAEKRIIEQGSDHFEQLKEMQVRAGWLQNLGQAMIQPFSIVFIISIFIYFYKSQMFNFASFAVSVYAINKIFANIQMVQSTIYTWNSLLPSLLNVSYYHEEARRHKEQNSGVGKFDFYDRLKFKNVFFSYEDDLQKNILSGLNLSINRGEMVGLIGSSGAGKTTVVDLLLRLFRPQKGEIVLDGINISDISLEDWRKNVGYVSQDIFLMNDTIENNIKFFDESITKKEIQEVIIMANSAEFIAGLPQGIQTVIGERGLKLSGGQRQRIVLARILARKPKILILDEATSSLDNESEILIQKAIEGLRGKITVIAIAHRLSTVLNFDKLFVLENGKIVEEGIPKNLLEDADSYFYKIYNLKQ